MQEQRSYRRANTTPIAFVAPLSNTLDRQYVAEEVISVVQAGGVHKQSRGRSRKRRMDAGKCPGGIRWFRVF